MPLEPQLLGQWYATGVLVTWQDYILVRDTGCLPFTQTTWVEILCLKIKLQNLTRWENCPINQLKRLKRVEKLHRLKLQPIFSQASQTDLRVPFDFPWGISGFPM